MKLSPERRAALEARLAKHSVAVAEAVALCDSGLVASIAEGVRATPDLTRWAPGEFVYEARFIHLLLPALARRLGLTALDPVQGWSESPRAREFRAEVARLDALAAPAPEDTTARPSTSAVP